MSKEKKDRRWDGRSRIPTKQYKDNYNDIFKKTKKGPKNISKPNHSNQKPDLGLNFQVKTEIVNGTCPHCHQETILVCLWQNCIYRCMTCGNDTKQKVNGKISYIPHVMDKDKFQYRLKLDLDGQET